MSRCLLVSNRLPLAYNEKTQEFKPSDGGLVSAIKGLDSKKIGYKFEWMGIMTDDVDAERLQQLKDTPFGDLRCHAIVVPKETYHNYYNMYCNNVIWPLFHYERSMVKHSTKGWQAYETVNRLVADAIIAEANSEDTIWVQDFQLFLVPGFIKEKRPDLKVGFFLHIPFPSSEIFRELPQRKEILMSLIQCDLVGFHDLSYMTHFKSSLQRILGECVFQFNERKWGVYPISIDTREFKSLALEQQTLDYIKSFSETKQDKKWILGIDRLDYIKGLVLKLRAFKEFLRAYPEEIGKVQMVQVVIPSRTDVPEYKELKHKIEQLVSSINGEFGSPTYTPVNYLYHSVSPYELSALYQLSEVMHIGSRRDGMNLVSLEYVVSQSQENPGTLLLSEFTGAHSTLSYAMSINPWNVTDTAAKMKEALYHPMEQRVAEMKTMQDFLTRYTSSEWASIFLRDLHKENVQTEKMIPLSRDGKFPWLKDLRGKRIVFFCDLDGTLAPIAKFPGNVRIQSRTQELLTMLRDNNDCEFVVVSGRDKEFLEEQFLRKNLELPIAACHGAYSYSPEKHEWESLVPHDATKWKENVLEIFKLYTSRTPGSFIEDKGHAITWHYRNSPKDFADFLANKLFLELEESLTSLPAQVSRGKKVIEVKSLHANKGIFVQHWLRNLAHKPDVVIALGDDTTDEDMFETLQEASDVSAYCIKVGDDKSLARYLIKEQNNVQLFLQNFVSSVAH